jgi:hypothetical protein
MPNEFKIKNGFFSEGPSNITGSLSVTAGITGSLLGTASYADNALSSSFSATASFLSGNAISASYAATASVLLGSVISSSYAATASIATSSSYALSSSYSISASYIDGTILNILTVGKSGSDNVDYYSIKDAVDSITGASETNPFLVQVYPGVFIENTITMKSWVTVKGDSSISTIVSASNASQSLFVGADQSMIIDMQIQGVTAPSASAVVYSSPTTPQTNAIFYVENVRFGTNYTHAKVVGTSGGNCIMQCSNVKYGGYPFTLGFYVTNDGSGVGRMQLRNVTSTNGGVSTTTDLIFAKADQPGCAFIVNGCLLTKAVGAAAGTGFWVENGGSLRLTAVNFQRWITGIYAPNVGSAPSIFGSALNFENNTTDVLIEHPTATGKIEGTDNFLKTIIPLDAPLYEVNQDPRKITVAKKGGDFTSISASVAYITGSSETNRFVIDIGPGQFIEKAIDLRDKPYVAIVGSTIQTTQILASGSGDYDQILLGPTNEISFLSIYGVNTPGYAAIKVDGTGDNFAQAHKVSIYDFDYGIKVLSSVSRSTFYGEYIDINGAFSYGTYVSASNTTASLASMENYYLFPSGGVSIGNYASGLGAELDLYTCLFVGDNVSGSTTIYLADGAVVEVAGFDAQYWEYGVRVPNIGNPPTFRMVGAMIHNSITSDFLVEQPATRGRFQGISDHTKINNASPDFYWNFLDDTDGENDVTRKLSVTFEDGTHTDATTLIFNGSAMGVLNRGEISVVTGLTASVSGGFGYVKVPSTEIYKRLDWPDTQIILPSSSNNYLYFDDNQTLLYGGTSPDYLNNIILGRVVTNQTDIAFIDQSPYLAAHTANLLSTFNRQALGPVYAEGSIVTANTAVSYSLDTTAGNYFYSENQFMPTGGTGITFTRYYVSGSGFNTTSTTTVPSNVYNSGSSLIPMSSSYFTKHSLYVVGQGIEEQYFLVVGQNQFATLVETEGANLPLPPTFFSDSVVSIASVYVQSGSSNIIQIEDIRPVIGFKASGVNASSVHGNLLGLSADDHTQYLLVDGARQMAANLGLGGNNIFNTNLITATSVSSSFTGSLIGTASYATQALSSSFATQALSSSFASTASIATSSSFALTASFAPSYTLLTTFNSFTGSVRTGSFTGSFTGSLLGTASFALQSVSSSFASTASFAPAYTLLTTFNSFTGSVRSGSFTGSFTGSVLGTASYANQALSSSFASTSSFAPNYTLLTSFNSFTSSYNTGSFTGSFTGSVLGTASYANQALSSSFASTASIATSSSFTLTASVATSSSFAATASFAPAYTTLTTFNSFTGSVRTGSFTGSFTGSVLGTSSYANQALSSSYALSASFAPTNTTGSFTGSFTGSVLGTSSYANQALSSSFASTTSFAPDYTLLTLFNSFTSSYNTGSFTGSFTGSVLGTASYATQALSSSFASTASFAPAYTLLTTFNNFTGSVRTGSFTGSFTGSLLGTASYANQALSSSFATQALSSSFASTALIATSSSFASTASFAPNYTTLTAFNSFTGSVRTGSFTGSFTGSLLGTSSYANQALSSSFASTASFAPAYTLLTTFNSFTSSYNTGSFTGSFTGSVLGTSSYSSQALSSSFASTASFAPAYTTLTAFNSFTGSFRTGSFTGSFTGSVLGTASYANQALSSSFAATASVLLGSVLSASYAATASIATSSSFASTASIATSSSFASTASIATSSSYALTASFALNGGGGGLTTKSGNVANTTFAGNPKKATVTFSTAFPNTNYAITITGEDSRTWTIENKAAGSFIIDANSNTNLSGTTYWICVAYGES